MLRAPGDLDIVLCARSCVVAGPAVLPVCVVVRQRAVVRRALGRSWKIRLPRKIRYLMEGVAELPGGDLILAPGCPLPRRGGRRPGQGRPGHACPVCLTGDSRPSQPGTGEQDRGPAESPAPSWQDRSNRT
jgi:hypothetical protein